MRDAVDASGTGTVNLDIFSCTARLRSMDVVDELAAFLEAGSVSVTATPRADGHRVDPPLVRD